MIFKKRIINYNYLNNIQANGSVVQLYETLSYRFVTNSSFYFNFLPEKIIIKDYLKKINFFLHYFLNSNILYLKKFNTFFINNKLYFSSLKKIKINKIYKRLFDIILGTSTISFYKDKDKVYKKNKSNVSNEHFVLNNFFILKLLESYHNNSIYNAFFNI